MIKIGEKIKRLRLDSGLTQTELAKKAGLHRVGLAKIESGQRKRPDLLTRKKLAEALGVDVKLLLKDTMYPKKWNEEVEEKVKVLESILPWLKMVERHKESSWEDVVSAGRARSQIKMAILDLYNLQYFDEKSARRWQESLDIHA